MTDKNPPSTYLRIYNIVAQIPKGRVMTYGQIARLVPRCTPRMVGYALAGMPDHLDLPWWRVINRLGEISLRRNAMDENLQRHILETEGVAFDANGRTDLSVFGFSGPKPHEASATQGRSSESPP